MNWKEIENSNAFWKVIWFSSTIVSVLVFVFSMVNEKSCHGSLLGLITLIALFGLGFEKPIWSLKLWEIVFWIVIILLGLEILVLIMDLFSTPEEDAINYTVNNQYGTEYESAIFMLCLLEIRGVYLYAFKRHNIWQSTSA